MRSNRGVYIGALFVGVSAFAVIPAAAQAADATSASAGQLEEVVVTAQRRAENQQTVPISVTTLTAATLAKSGVTSTDELLTVTPGLVMTRQLRGSTPFLRGIGATVSAPGLESPVSQYVDGVYFMAPAGNIFSFNNVERIEVLKGPQGTLFGRNATGGLINVITRDPKADPAFEGSATYGSYETWSTALYATAGAGPIAADLAIYAIEQNKGFGHNLNTGADVNLLDEFAIRSKILWTPTENDRVTLSADAGSNKSDIGFTRNAVAGSLLFGRTPLRGSVYDTQGGFPTGVEHFDVWGSYIKYQHDFGWGSFQSLTSYRSQDSESSLDQDGTPTRVVDVVIHERNTWGQQELLLVGQTGRLDWTTGVFILQATSAYDPLAVSSGLLLSNNTRTFVTQETHSYAAFLQGTFALTDRTRATIGARYTVDERNFSGRSIATAGHPLGAGATIATNFGDRRFPKLTWRFSIDHRFSDDIMAYASYSRGFKSGSFNTGSFTSPPVSPETLDAVEVGVKSEFFQRTLRFNASAFHYDYADLQLTRVVTGASLLFNAASAEVDGIDLEAVVLPPAPVGNLQLTFGLSWLDANYKSFPNGAATVPSANGGNATIARDLGGNRMIRAPKWIATAGIDYSVPLGAGVFEVSANYYYNDGFFWEPDNRLRQSSYNVANAQLAYAFGPDQAYRLRVFGKNLTDARYGAYIASGGLGDLASFAAPRTYGVGLDVRF